MSSDTLTVWGVTTRLDRRTKQRLSDTLADHRQHRVIVAAPTAAAAVRRFLLAGLSVTPYELRHYGSPTGNRTEVDLALGEVGTVFVSSTLHRDPYEPLPVDPDLVPTDDEAAVLRAVKDGTFDGDLRDVLRNRVRHGVSRRRDGTLRLTDLGKALLDHADA